MGGAACVGGGWCRQHRDPDASQSEALVRASGVPKAPRSAFRNIPMNIMTPAVATTTAAVSDIAESTSAACISTRVRQLSRIVTRVYDDALRPLGITASQFT